MRPGPRKRKARALESKRHVMADAPPYFWTTRGGLWNKSVHGRRWRVYLRGQA